MWSRFKRKVFGSSSSHHVDDVSSLDETLIHSCLQQNSELLKTVSQQKRSKDDSHLTHQGHKVKRKSSWFARSRDHTKKVETKEPTVKDVEVQTQLDKHPELTQTCQNPTSSDTSDVINADVIVEGLTMKDSVELVEELEQECDEVWTSRQEYSLRTGKGTFGPTPPPDSAVTTGQAVPHCLPVSNCDLTTASKMSPPKLKRRIKSTSGVESDNMTRSSGSTTTTTRSFRTPPDPPIFTTLQSTVPSTLPSTPSILPCTDDVKKPCDDDQQANEAVRSPTGRRVPPPVPVRKYPPTPCTISTANPTLVEPLTIVSPALSEVSCRDVRNSPDSGSEGKESGYVTLDDLQVQLMRSSWSSDESRSATSAHALNSDSCDQALTVVTSPSDDELWPAPPSPITDQTTTTCISVPVVTPVLPVTPVSLSPQSPATPTPTTTPAGTPGTPCSPVVRFTFTVKLDSQLLKRRRAVSRDCDVTECPSVVIPDVVVCTDTSNKTTTQQQQQQQQCDDAMRQDCVSGAVVKTGVRCVQQQTVLGCRADSAVLAVDGQLVLHQSRDKHKQQQQHQQQQIEQQTLTSSSSCQTEQQQQTTVNSQQCTCTCDNNSSTTGRTGSILHIDEITTETVDSAAAAGAWRREDDGSYLRPLVTRVYTNHTSQKHTNNSPVERDDEMTHMSWGELLDEAETMGIPLNGPHVPLTRQHSASRLSCGSHQSVCTVSPCRHSLSTVSVGRTTPRITENIVVSNKTPTNSKTSLRDIFRFPRLLFSRSKSGNKNVTRSKSLESQHRVQCRSLPVPPSDNNTGETTGRETTSRQNKSRLSRYSAASCPSNYKLNTVSRTASVSSSCTHSQQSEYFLSTGSWTGSSSVYQHQGQCSGVVDEFDTDTDDVCLSPSVSSFSSRTAPHIRSTRLTSPGISSKTTSRLQQRHLTNTSPTTDFSHCFSQLHNCGWYWGALSFDEAEAKLCNRRDGSFLVRDSSDERYILSLSFRSLGTTHHTRIEHYKGCYSFCSQPPTASYSQSTTIVEFIEAAMSASRDGCCLYYLRPRAPGLPAAPVRLVFPVSRYRCMHSLQHLCKFAVLRHVRLDLVDRLPVAPRLKEYLKHGRATVRDHM